MTPSPTHEEGSKCVFCDIARRSGVDILDIEPLNPVVKGHRIVFSRHHSTDFTDDVGITMRVMEYASELAKKNGGEYNLITSKGKNATQSVFHLHVHLVPRKKGDELLLPWSSISPLLVAEERKVREQTLKQMTRFLIDNEKYTGLEHNTVYGFIEKFAAFSEESYLEGKHNKNV